MAELRAIVTPPCYTGNMELEACGYYEDWFRPDVGQLVIELLDQYEDWELEVIIAAEAHYALNFLNPN